MSQGQLEQPCVLADVHVFDCTARQWLPLAANVSLRPSPSSDDSGLVAIAEEASIAPILPTARYAHLSSISRDRLYIMGGQNLNNE